MISRREESTTRASTVSSESLRAKRVVSMRSRAMPFGIRHQRVSPDGPAALESGEGRRLGSIHAWGRGGDQSG